MYRLAGNVKWISGRILLFFLLCTLDVPALYAEGTFSWTVSPMLGVHSPALTGLNGAEFDATLTGTGDIVLDSSSALTVPLKIINPLEDIRYGTEAGLEFEFNFWPRDAFLFGLSSWEGVTTSQVNTEMPFQGVMSQAAFERSADISYTQYYLGWKHYFLDKPKRYKAYSRLTLHELFDVDFREQLVFGFTSGPADTFMRNIIMESQATGIMMPMIGGGMDWYLNDWLSIGFDAGYTFDIRKSVLSHASIKTDLQSGDNLTLELPAQLEPGTLEMMYKTSDGSYKKIHLSFAGWRALLHITFHF